jgi:hypothetical protein
MRLSKRTLTRFSGLFLAAMVCLSCSKSSDTDTAAVAEEDDTVDPEETNALAVAFPDQLALNVFPTSSSSLRLADDEAAPSTETQEELIKENRKKLRGGADTECFDPSSFKREAKDNAVTCYAFDSDMNPHKVANRPGKSWGTKNGLDDEGEACLVAFTRQETNQTLDLVKKSLALVSGMICQAKKNNADVAMPEAGKELDLKADMKAAAGSTMPVTEAKIEAEEGTSLADGTSELIYRSTITIKDPSGNELQVHLTNQKTEDGEVGLLSLSRPAKARLRGKSDSNNSENKQEVLSIAYEFTKEDDIPNAKVELRRAAIEKSIEAFDDAGLVNFKGVPETATNSDLHMSNLVRFDMNPETGAGNFEYWMNPGAGYSESARGFVFNVEENEGKLSGCAITGAAFNVSIRKSLVDEAAELEPTGWWHPQHSQNIDADKDTAYNAQQGSKVTKQCFEQDAEGVYAVSTDATRGYELVDPAKSGVSIPTPVKQDMLPPPPPNLKK